MSTTEYVIWLLLTYINEGFGKKTNSVGLERACLFLLRHWESSHKNCKDIEIVILNMMETA